MSRYDTTPNDEDRAHARDAIGRGADPLIRRELALDFIGARLEALTEVDDPVDARIIARARALYQTYREESYE